MAFDIRNFLGNYNQPMLQAGLGLLSGQTPQQQVALGAQGLTQGLNQNLTMKWLESNNPELAQGVKMGAISPRDAFQMAYETKTAKVKPNIIGAGKNLYNADTGQWISPPADMNADNGDNYFGTVIKGYDPQGNPIYLQPGKNGVANQIKLPDGFQPENRTDKIDLGDSWMIRDNTNGSSQIVPKNLAGAEQQKAIGKAQGEAAVTLPASVQQAEQTVKQIDELANSDGLDSIVGGMDQYRPSWTLGASGRDALTRYNQLKGRSFLQAYDMLKGGGQITEVEGQKAQDAMARMDRSLSEADFRIALKDFRDAVEMGIQKLKAQAGAYPQSGQMVQPGDMSQPPGAGQMNATSSGIQWKVK